MIGGALGRAVGRRTGGPVLNRLARLAGGPPPGLRRGLEDRSADVPVIGVVLVGVATGPVGRVLESVREAQGAGAPFTPVFLVDAPVLAPFRRAGYVVELVGPAGMAMAVQEVRASYGCAAVVGLELTAAAPSLLRDLLTGVNPGRPRGLGRGRALLRRLEARLS